MIQLSVISPQRVAYSAEIVQVTVPGADGQLTILPQHTPLFAQLVEGELKVIPKEDEPLYMAIGGGFIEVLNDKVNILVTRAVHETELNEEEIRKAKEQAEQVLKQAPSIEERRAATALLHSRLTDLKVLRRRRRKQTTPIS